MNVSVPDVPASVIARYEAAARLRGVSVADFLREHLIEHAPTRTVEGIEAHATTAAERFALLRAKIVESGIPLLTDDELRAEIRERRGIRTETGH